MPWVQKRCSCGKILCSLFPRVWMKVTQMQYSFSGSKEVTSYLTDLKLEDEQSCAPNTCYLAVLMGNQAPKSFSWCDPEFVKVLLKVESLNGNPQMCLPRTVKKTFYFQENYGFEFPTTWLNREEQMINCFFSMIIEIIHISRDQIKKRNGSYKTPVKARRILDEVGLQVYTLACSGEIHRLL